MSAIHDDLRGLGQITLVLQGGGALGAYQAGVYEALWESSVEPDWVIGTSIGAINAALIVGNKRENRCDALREFWRRVESDSFMGVPLPSWLTVAARNMMTMTTGIPSFFQPNPGAFVSMHAPLGADNAGYYSVEPLRRSLTELVDFDLIAKGEMRLTVGACKVKSSEMIYFDSRETAIGVDHILASGALPPAFPPVRIDGDLYWDGGIMSNTPVEVVFDDNPRRNGVVFAVHLWNPDGEEPNTIMEVMNRHKDVQYSSRASTHIHRQRQLHRMRHIIAELGKRLPEEAAGDNLVKEMTAWGCLTEMHVVRLLAPRLSYEDHAKDNDFSQDGIHERWSAGHRHTLSVLARRPWRDGHDPLDGFILHEACGGRMIETEAGERV